MMFSIVVLVGQASEADDFEKFVGTWEFVESPQAPPDWEGMIVHKFYSNGTFKWYDIKNLGGYKFEGTWELAYGQLVTHWTYPDTKTETFDYLFSDNDQRLTLTLGNTSMAFSKTLEEAPSISYNYNSLNRILTIIVADTGYYYSGSLSSSDANLIFVKEDVTYYIMNDLLIDLSGDLSTKEIQAGDQITGFKSGVYSMIWESTGDIIGTLTFLGGEETPSISFMYNSTQNTFTIISADSGYYYSDSTSSSDANLAFKGRYDINDREFLYVTYYVLNDLTIDTSGILSTKEIQVGDKIYGFNPGSYEVLWNPTEEVIGTFTVVSEGAKQLHISTGCCPTEGTSFSVKVSFYCSDAYSLNDGTTNGYWFPLKDATVVFLNNSYLTDLYGHVTLLAPLVEQNTVYTIYASKAGYLSTMGDVTVVDSSDVTTGWIYGVVLFRSNDITYPAKNVKVQIYPSKTDTTGKNIILEAGPSTSTDENGEYKISNVETGTYMIKAGRNPYLSEKFIEVNENEGTETNFIIDISETRFELEKSIESGIIGGEINIERSDSSKFEQKITIYEGVEIKPTEITKDRISLIVSGDEYGGSKTIAITVDPSLFENVKDIVVKYDGEAISMADNITDVLNPNDDGSHAEYLLTSGANATEILISIPHFSEHEITVYSVAGAVVETLGGVNAVLTYIAICVIAAVLFVGTIYIRRRF